jgi:cell wall-associated NlpC family hydrolase
MNAAPDVNDLIGKGWLIGGRGPDRYDCWGLVREVLQRMRPGLPLPDWASDEMTRERQRALMAEAFPAHCTPATDLVPGVLLHSERAAHIAIVVGGGMVLEVRRSVGVAAMRAADYTRQFADMRAYTWRA